MELAVAPYGATNSFIRSFGEGKADLFKDIASLAEAPTVPTDMINIGNNCAINGCTVGLTPAVTIKVKETDAKLEKGLNRFVGALWFFLNNLTSLFDKEIVAHQYKVTIDDNDYSGSYSLINIINAPCFGRPRNALKGVMPDDGLLDVILIKSAGFLSTTRYLRKFSRGRLPRRNCVSVQAKKIVIQSDKPMWIQTDSEYLKDTNITFEVVPNAVQIVAVNNLTYQRF
jgi:diacylglycerol kinase family enzyme